MNQPKTIHEQIKLKEQDFFSSFKEFNPVLQEKEGEVLFQEFEIVTGFKNLEIELKSMFDRASKILKVSVISELEDCEYIQIVRLIEKKVSKTDVFILQVKVLFLVLFCNCDDSLI